MRHPSSKGYPYPKSRQRPAQPLASAPLVAASPVKALPKAEVFSAAGIQLGEAEDLAAQKTILGITTLAPLDASYVTMASNSTLSAEQVAGTQAQAFIVNGILYLKDNAGTPHYWRVDVSTLGVLSQVDVGTTVP